MAQTIAQSQHVQTSTTPSPSCPQPRRCPLPPHRSNYTAADTCHHDAYRTLLGLSTPITIVENHLATCTVAIRPWHHEHTYPIQNSPSILLPTPPSCMPLRTLCPIARNTGSLQEKNRNRSVNQRSKVRALCLAGNLAPPASSNPCGVTWTNKAPIAPWSLRASARHCRPLPARLRHLPKARPSARRCSCLELLARRCSSLEPAACCCCRGAPPS